MTQLFDLSTEKSILRISVLGAVFISTLGIVFGLISGSGSIMFDGIYSLIDAVMSLLTLVVVNLITAYSLSAGLSRKLRDRFSMGFWHLEPMVIGLNGTLLIGAAVYALFNAISTIIEGGRDLEFGWALAYAVVTVIFCFTMMTVESRANKTIKSDFISLDVKGWLMSGAITAALLVAFCFGIAVQGTQYAWVSPYIDPVVLALVCLLIIPVPIATVSKAFGDMLLFTPAELKNHVDKVASAFMERRGFLSYRAYVSRVGRSKNIEIYFIVPTDAPARPITGWDQLREEIGVELGGEGPDRWLTIVFTADPEWAE
jgi:predicted Co/Zn/Cd cation transporter (cation efflux family)